MNSRFKYISNNYYVGGLDIYGRVVLPRDIKRLLESKPCKLPLITAAIPEETALNFDVEYVRYINSIDGQALSYNDKSDNSHKILPQELQEFIPITPLLDKLKLCMIGNLKLLLIGPPGIGKSNISNIIKKLSDFQIYSNDKDILKHSNSIAIYPTQSKREIDHLLDRQVTQSLYIDEVNRFHSSKIEIIRKLLDTAEYPIIASMNPCKCGYFKVREGKCICSKNDLRKFWTRFDATIFDRFDVVIGIDSTDAETNAYKEQKLISVSELSQEIEGLKNAFSQHIESIFTESEAAKFLNKYIESNHASIRLIKSIHKVAKSIAIKNSQTKVSYENIVETLSLKIKHPLISGLIE